jgi:competence protein ComEC
MRKLAMAAIAFSVAIFTANYILPIKWLLRVAALIAGVGIVFITILIILKKNYKLYAVLMLFFAIGLYSFYFHNRNTVIVAEEYAGESHWVMAEVLDFPEIYDDYCRIIVRLESGKQQKLKALLYDNDKQLLEAKPGNKIYMAAHVKAADTLYGEKYDNYHSKGIYLKLSSAGYVQLFDGFKIKYLPQYVSHFLSAKINEIFPDDTEVFMRSLMLGDKTDFYDSEELYVSLSRAGLMHIVAVSGMHISFLVGLMQSLLGRGRRSAFMCIALLWFFVFVTGAGASVIRAAFMHTYFLMAPILRRQNDSITSLSVILATLLLINPFAIASISLQLSFGAMCGIVLFSDKIHRMLSSKLSTFSGSIILRGIVASISCSLSVMVFTIPLTALHFGNVQLLSPVTNLISLWAVAACFCWGWISCALSVFPVLGVLSATLCSYLARYIILVAKLISAIPFSVLYMQTKFAYLWVVGVYVLFAVPYALRIKNIAVYLTFAIFSALSAALLMYGTAMYYKTHETLNILDVGQGQCVTLLTGESTIVLDCGSINTLDNAGAIAASHLYSRGRPAVDMLVLSHLHEDHASGAVMLMEMMKVKTLILADNYDETDPLYLELSDCARRRGTELIQIDEDYTVRTGDTVVELLYNDSSADENESCIISKITHKGIEFLAMSDASRKMERGLVEEYDLSSIDILLVSHHGSKYSSDAKLLEEIEGETAIISTGWNYYGHPDDETLDALETYGYNVYRTDELGDIEIRVGNSYVEKNWKDRYEIKLPR